jgi:uncharacterized protein YdhG (YjbR/CyaY superfamily)
MSPRQHFKSIDEYISIFPEDVQKILEKVRTTIYEVAPKAEGTISYQIPTFKLDGKYLIYFAGYEHHISLYPIYAGNESLKKELAPYLSGKATAKFQLDEPIPYDLIKKIIKFRMKENQENYK